MAIFDHNPRHRARYREGVDTPVIDSINKPAVANHRLIVLSGKLSTGFPVAGNRPLLLFFFLGEAVAAIDGPVLARAEGHLGFGITGSANGREHFALGPSVALALVSAALAALGFVYKTFFGVKLLFTGGEDERASTFFAV